MISLVVDMVQYGEDLHFGDTTCLQVEALEAGVDQVNELIVRVAVLETTVNSILIHR